MSVERPPWARRALSNVEGPITRAGDPAVSDGLAEALALAAIEDPDTLTHGVHAWPARMHRATAGALVSLVAPRRLLDPFAGGGTVLVEALVRGVPSVGVDLNPLSALVAGVRTAIVPEAARTALLDAVFTVAERSEARVRARVPVVARLPRELAALHPPHVLKELAGLLEELRRVPDRDARRAMAVVFSSLLVKLSVKRADTSDALEEKRLRKGLATELFVRKARELAHRWELLEASVPPGTRAPVLCTGDARALPALLEGLPGPGIDAIVTSPPYGGTYDYTAHHALRLAWLGLDAGAFERDELGARRRLRDVRAWDAELGEALAAMASVLVEGGRMVLVLGDAQVGGERVPVLPQLERIAGFAGLALVAAASAERPDWLGGPPRAEHAVALRRVAQGSARRGRP